MNKSSIDVTKFVKQLRGKIEWDSESKMHWSGMVIITNADMMIMCSHYYGREYDLLTYREQRFVREDVFRKLRGVENEQNL